MKFFAKTALASAFFALASGCEREYVLDRTNVCFESEVLPIFQSKCAETNCHSAFDREAGIDLSSHAGILAAGVAAGEDHRKSRIYQVLVKAVGPQAMPPAPRPRLEDEEIALIAAWIEHGAENTTGCRKSSPCDTSEVRFEATVRPILNRHCVNCHGGSSPQGGLDYSNFLGVKQSAKSSAFLGSVRHEAGFSAMPKNGLKMSACEIAALEIWVAAGAKND